MTLIRPGLKKSEGYPPRESLEKFSLFPREDIASLLVCIVKRGCTGIFKVLENVHGEHSHNSVEILLTGYSLLFKSAEYRIVDLHMN